MPCYTVKIPKASTRDYHLWKSIGYTGTYDKYKLAKQNIDGQTMIMCGDLGDHCADCGSVAEILCDYPVGDSKTCDRPICECCAKLVGLDVHYCKHHYAEWEKFKAAGGVEKELKNIVPFEGA